MSAAFDLGGLRFEQRDFSRELLVAQVLVVRVGDPHVGAHQASVAVRRSSFGRGERTGVIAKPEALAHYPPHHVERLKFRQLLGRERRCDERIG